MTAIPARPKWRFDRVGLDDAAAGASEGMAESPLLESLRRRLAESLPLIENHRSKLTAMMQARLAELAGEGESCARADVAGAMLVDLLVHTARDLAAWGRVSDLDLFAAEHLRLGIDGRDYLRFGLVLGPLLEDLRGPPLKPPAAAAWRDAFWHAIGQMPLHSAAPSPLPLTGAARR